MGEAATSRKMVVRAGWSDEEARADLQDRLTVLSTLMFWSFVILLVFMHVMYAVYPEHQPADERTILLMAAGGLTLLAVIWRALLVRRTLTSRQLNAIDLFYAAGTGTILGTSAYLARDFHPSAYGCALYASFMVLLRAIIVPSTGPRTAITGAALCLPMVIASIPVSLLEQQDLKPGAFVGGAVVMLGVVIVLATVGSRVIYGLRKQARFAMQLGSYTLVQKIGQGGMGVVYRARHTLLRRPTAVKLLHPEHVTAETINRFEQEVQHTSQLTHPNTVAVFDYGRSGGNFYYAMEYLDGIDLDRLVKQHGPQPADRVVKILEQVCGALHEAHGNGITHRDIKPANIILCERGAVPDVAKVVDFGLVKEMTANDGSSARTILGTPAYIAPEAVTAPEKVGPATDLYALGAVAYFLLTGKLVFDGPTSVDICVKHVGTVPTPPSQVAAIHIPAALEALVLECLSKDPAERPTAESLGKRLRALAAAGDWTEDDALQWWDDFHAAGGNAATTPVDPATETMTITVDFGRRALLTPPPRRRARTSQNQALGKAATRTKRPSTAA